jgi:hypothetical protein
MLGQPLTPWVVRRASAPDIESAPYPLTKRLRLGW